MGRGDRSKVGNTGGWFGLFNNGIKSVKSPEDIMHGAVEEGEREREGLLSEIEDETEEEVRVGGKNRSRVHSYFQPSRGAVERRRTNTLLQLCTISAARFSRRIAHT